MVQQLPPKVDRSPDAHLQRIMARPAADRLAYLDKTYFSKGFKAAIKGKASREELAVLIEHINLIPIEFLEKIVQHCYIKDTDLLKIIKAAFNPKDYDQFKSVKLAELHYGKPWDTQRSLVVAILKHPNISKETILDMFLLQKGFYENREIRKLARKKGITKQVLESLDLVQLFDHEIISRGC